MARLVFGCLIALFCLLSFSICCSDCQMENQWLTYGGSGTREFRVFNDNHPFFNGTKPTGKSVSFKYDNSTDVIDPASLVSVDDWYLYRVPATSESVVMSALTGELIYSDPCVLSVLLSRGFAFLYLDQKAKQVSVFRVSDDPNSRTSFKYNMDDGFDWDTMVVAGDALSLDSSLFLWGNEIDNRSLFVDLKQDMTPLEDVAMKWLGDRSTYVVWEEGSKYHSVWTSIVSRSISFTITHTTFFPYVTNWVLKVPFYPVISLYHTRAESFIYLDQEGIKCVDLANGSLSWTYPVPNHKIKQLAASDRKENGHYLYFINDTYVTFLEFDGNRTQEAKKFSPEGDVIQALSVLHGDDEGEEILFVSGLSNAFYAVSTNGNELFRASGNQCLSPIIFKENSTFICADKQGVRFFSFEASSAPPTPTDDGGLAAGWIALIVIGSIVGVVILLAVVYFVFKASAKKSGPEMIF